MIVNEDGTITYTPDLDYYGEDGFTYTVSDSNGGSSEATTHITINNLPEYFYGTSGDDTLTGGDEDDLLYGYAVTTL